VLTPAPLGEELLDPALRGVAPPRQLHLDQVARVEATNYRPLAWTPIFTST